MSIISACLLAQNRVFQKLLEDVRVGWPPAAAGTAALEEQCFTLVLVPDRACREAIDSRLEILRQRFGEHIYYGAPNLHVTVFGIHEKLVSEMVMSHLHRFLAAHLGALKPFSMPLGGFSIVGNTLVVKAFDGDGKLLEFCRLALRELTDEIYGEGIDVEAMIGLHSEIFWLSAARLAADADPALLEYVTECADESIATATFDEMLLCSTDQLFSPGKTTVLRNYPLGLIG